MSSKKKIIYTDKTPYNYIVVIEYDDIRELWFKSPSDYFLQSRISIKDLIAPRMIYSQLLLAGLFLNPSPKRILVLGVGGGLVPHYFSHYFPDVKIDAVDIDKGVIKASKKYFYLKETERVKVHEADGRLFIQNQIGKVKYDFIVLDAFKSGSVPFHLKTLQFYEEIRAVLAPGGVVASNLYGKSNALKPHDLKTFSQIFKQIYLFEDPEKVSTLLFATESEKRATQGEFRAKAELLMKRHSFSTSLEAVAEMAVPNEALGKIAYIFKDNFQQNELKEAAKKNNLDNQEPRPYAIVNQNPD